MLVSKDFISDRVLQTVCVYKSCYTSCIYIRDCKPQITQLQNNHSVNMFCAVVLLCVVSLSFAIQPRGKVTTLKMVHFINNWLITCLQC